MSLDGLESGIQSDKAGIGHYYLQGSRTSSGNSKIIAKPIGQFVGWTGEIYCAFPDAFLPVNMPVFILASRGNAPAVAMQLENGDSGDTWNWTLDNKNWKKLHYEVPSKGTMQSMSDGGSGSDRMRAFVSYQGMTQYQNNPRIANKAHPTLQLVPTGAEATKACDIYYDGTNLVAMKEDGVAHNLV